MAELKKALGPLMLWGLGVGYVISGMYFGWNLGLPLGGTWGMLVATLIVTVLYVTFIFSYAELAVAIPKAGGANRNSTICAMPSTKPPPGPNARSPKSNAPPAFGIATASSA